MDYPKNEGGYPVNMTNPTFEVVLDEIDMTQHINNCYMRALPQEDGTILVENQETGVWVRVDLNDGGKGLSVFFDENAAIENLGDHIDISGD